MNSQHPADLKPRGVKAPLHLLPWEVVPGAPEAIRVLYPAQYLDIRGDRPLRLLECLLKSTTLNDIARVFEYGAKKYARDNWRSFTWDQLAEDTYFGAICRHLTAKEDTDPESGLPHKAHAAAGAMIWLWHVTR